MPLFARHFAYYELTNDGYDVNGDPVETTTTSRTVTGTVQPLSANEVAAMAEGDRQNGSVKVYSSDRLAVRSQLGSKQGFVKDANGNVYELIAESTNLNGLISHYKYIAALVPVAQIPEALQ